MNIPDFFSRLTSIEFWETLFGAYAMGGPAVALLLPMIEAFIPALPQIAIAALNVGAFGTIKGFLYTWLGSSAGNTVVFLFYRHVLKHATDYLTRNGEKIRSAREWVSDFDPFALFLLMCLPFTPSSFLNFAFGISDFNRKSYLITMLLAKIIMIGSLVFFGKAVTDAPGHPLQLIIGLAVMAILYWISVVVRNKYHLGKKQNQ